MVRTAPISLLREGKGPPLVLFHGVLGGPRMWREVITRTAAHHDTVAPAALGHAGGTSAGPAGRSRVTVHDLVDDAERRLDALGFDQAHLAGNSLGGYMALELARRGRARSVTVFSPLGFWDPAMGRSARAARDLRRTMRDTRLGRPLLPLLGLSPGFRRWALRLNAVRGDRLGVEGLVAAADDLLGCTVGEDILATREVAGELAELRCPVTVAWSEHDRVFPVRVNGERARAAVRAAGAHVRYIVLEGLGHVPMFDDPGRVAALILETTGAPGS